MSIEFTRLSDQCLNVYIYTLFIRRVTALNIVLVLVLRREPTLSSYDHSTINSGLCTFKAMDFVHVWLNQYSVHNVQIRKGVLPPSSPIRFHQVIDYKTFDKCFTPAFPRNSVPAAESEALGLGGMDREKSFKLSSQFPSNVHVSFL